MEIIGSCRAGVLTLRFSGELDHHAAGEAMHAIAERIDTLLPRRCVLDLSELSFMDSAGIALILRTEKKMRELDGSLRITGAPPQPKRILQAARMDRKIPIT